MGLIELLMALVLIGLIVASRWSSRPAVSTPVCARCAYIIHETTNTRCPECGADLTSVGVVSPDLGRTAIAGRFATVLVVGLCLFSVIAGLLSWRLSRAVMRPNRSVFDVTVSVDQPASGTYQSFLIEGWRTTRNGRLEFGPYCLHLVWNDGTRSDPLCLTPPARPVPAGGPLSGGPLFTDADLPRERLSDWARTIGLDPSDDALGVELDDMHRIATGSIRTDDVVVGVPLNGLAGTITLSGGTRAVPRREPIIIGIGVGAIALGFGGVSIQRRMKRERDKRISYAQKVLNQ